METTVEQLLTEWFERASMDMATTTRQTTESAIKILIEDFGPISVDSIRPLHIDDWHAARRAAGYSRGYNVRIAGVLGTACVWGIKRDYCISNPVANAKQKKETGRKVKSPTPDAVKAALAWAKAHDFLLWVFLEIDTIIGARRSEILGLMRDDFDPDMMTLTIRRVVVPCKGGIAIEERTKTDSGARVVSVDEELADLLQKWLATHDSPWLFPGRDKSLPMNPTSITHKVQRLGDALGFRLHAHAFRHYCATTSLASGIAPPIVAARMGDTVSTIHKIYAHAVRSNDRGAADALRRSIS